MPRVSRSSNNISRAPLSGWLPISLDVSPAFRAAKVQNLTALAGSETRKQLSEPVVSQAAPIDHCPRGTSLELPVVGMDWEGDAESRKQKWRGRPRGNRWESFYPALGAEPGGRG